MKRFVFCAVLKYSFNAGLLPFLLTITTCPVHAQGSNRTVVQPGDLEKMEGAWLGFLFYKDYQSGQMQRIHASINVSRSAATTGNVWQLEYDYPREPGHKSTSTYILNKTGDSLGDAHVIERKTLPGGGISFTTESKGKDGNQQRAAVFHHIWTVQGDSLLITKMVRYENEDSFIMRNTYRLKTVTTK